MTNEIKVALLTLVSLAILFFGYRFLSGKKVFSTQQAITVYFENVDGLLPGNPVTLGGVNVGTVADLVLNQDGRNTSVRADLLIDSHIKVPKEGSARIVGDLLGDNIIEIVYPSSGNITYAQSGDVLKGEVEMDMATTVQNEIIPLKEKAERLFESMDSLMVNANKILGSQEMEETFASVTRSVATVEATVGNLNKLSKEMSGLIVDESEKLRSIITHFESISRTLDARGAEITSILQNADTFSADLAGMDLKKTGDELNLALGQFSSIMNKINTGEGSIGLLLEDEELYNNLTSSSANLDRLFTHVQENPGKYVHFSVFGRKDKKDKKNKK